MLFQNSLALAGMAGLAHAMPGALLPRGEYECPAGYEHTVIQCQVQEVTYPVIINQYFEHNTVVIINGGVTININNAPTQLSTTVTVTTTSTVTSTVPAATNTVPAVFLLEIVPLGVAKRQSTASFLGADGAVGGCAGAITASLANSILSSNGGTFGTDTFTGSQIFSTSSGATKTSFLSVGGALTWQNTKFQPNGVVSFCTLASVVQVVFDGVLPTGCTPVSLLIVDTGLCATTSSSTSSSVSSSATETGTSSVSTSATVSGSSTSVSSTSASSSVVDSSTSSSSVGSSTTSGSSTSSTASSTSSSASPSATGCPLLGQILSTVTGECVCDSDNNFGGGLVGGNLVCAVCLVDQIVSSETGRCICDPGTPNLGGTIIDSVLNCALCLVGQVVDPATGACACDRAGGFGGNVVANVLTCAACITGQLVNDAGTCACATGQGIATIGNALQCITCTATGLVLDAATNTCACANGAPPSIVDTLVQCIIPQITCAIGVSLPLGGPLCDCPAPNVRTTIAGITICGPVVPIGGGGLPTLPTLPGLPGLPGLPRLGRM